MSRKIIPACLVMLILGTALIISGLFPNDDVSEVTATIRGCRSVMQRSATRTYAAYINVKPNELRIQFNGITPDNIESRFALACKTREPVKLFYSKSRWSVPSSYWIEGIESLKGTRFFSIEEYRSSQGDNHYFLILFGVLLYGVAFEIYRKGRKSALGASKI